MTGSSVNAALVTNPFVGPHPIEAGQKIFGRDREIEELYYLLSAERIVLLHSPSGAGKSSLIQAGLVPRMAQRFDVWGPARVNLPLPLGAAEVNRYARSANLGFEAGIPEARQRPKEMLSRLTVSEYVAGRPRRRSAPPNVVLIFDQFEEILTVDPLGLEAREEFFDQLGKLLQDPRIWALFALREDYLAPLDPYAERIPTHMKNRFRLDLLGREAAGEAIARPVEEGGREFAAAAVGKLVNDLATMQVQRADGTFERQTGPYVEPMHLQVACRGLWERLPGDRLTIAVEDIESFGDVTKALAEYYAREVGGIGGGDERVVRAVREWVGGKLITPEGIRGQVLKGAGQSEGLENALIARLVDTHLVRAEQRAGAVWYELAHDRLIEPVRSNNREWLETHLTKVQKVASVWEAQGRPEGLLLIGADLEEAKGWAAVNESSLTIIERKYLAASTTKQAGIHRERRKKRLIQALAVFACVGLLVALSFYRQAEKSAQKARIETIKRRISQARTEFQISPTRGLLLAVEALNASRREQLTCARDVTCAQSAAEALLDLLSRTGGTPLFGHKEPVVALSFSADGKILASADRWGGVNLWRAEQLQAPFAVLSGSSRGHTTTVSLSANGKLVATAGFSFVNLYRSDEPTARPHKFQIGMMENIGSRTSVYFSRDGKLLLMASGAITASLWQLDHLDNPIAEWGRSPTSPLGVKFAVFTPDGKFILTLDHAGKVWQWRLDQLNGKQEPVLLADLKGSFSAAFFSPDGKHLLIPRQPNTEGLQSTARLVDLDNPKSWEDKTVDDGNSGRAATLSADGQFVATADDGDTVRVWRTDKLDSAFKKLRGHEGPVQAALFSPDGKFIATGGSDQTARLWRVDQPMAIPNADRSLENWMTRLDELKQLAGKTAGRNFTKKEWSELFPDEEYHRTFPNLRTPEDRQ